MRLLDKKTGERHPLLVGPDLVSEFVERMGREIHAAATPPKAEAAQVAATQALETPAMNAIIAKHFGHDAINAMIAQNALREILAKCSNAPSQPGVNG